MLEPTTTPSPVLRITALRKLYPPATQALRSFDMELRRGEIHGLAGVNGAGKSTVIKILSGVESPTSGTIWLDGVGDVEIGTPAQATRLGIGVVHQELPLLPNLTAAENVDLGTVRVGPLAFARRRQTERAYRKAAERFPTAPPAGARLETLGVYAWQVVAIVRALTNGAGFLILDEPTSSLNTTERAALHALLRDVARDGTAIIYVSHFLDDVLGLCDRVTVVRDGEVVACEPAAELTERSLLVHMLGAEQAVEAVERAGVTAAPPVAEAAHGAGLELRDLVTGGAGPVTLDVAAGECVGLYGLQGSGAHELLEAVFALRGHHGEVRWRGKRVRGDTRKRIRQGLALVTGDRRRSLIGDWTVAMNHSLPDLGFHHPLSPVRRDRERRGARTTIDKLDVKGTADSAMRTLSGGNQQKVALGRWLTRPQTCLLADEPTLGVDAHGRASIHELLLAHREQGNAVLVQSTDPEELVSICSRVFAMANGRVVRELRGSELTVAALEASTRSTERGAEEIAA